MTARKLVAGVTACFLTLFLAACGPNDDTDLARLEAAKIAIDAGDYASAEALLLTFCTDPLDVATCDPSILELLAEARMGLGGVDLLNLLAAYDGLVPTGNTDAFVLIDAMFGPGGVTAQSVADLQNALDTLAQIASPTADEELMTAVAAATHLAASIILAADPDGDGVYDTTGVNMTALTATVANDLAIVQASAAAVDAALGGTSDITSALDGLVADIEAAGGGVVNGTIEQAELTNFIDLSLNGL